MATFGNATLTELFSAEQRWLNLYGEKGARHSTGQSLYQEITQTYFFFNFFSFFLFFTPPEYLEKLYKASHDSQVHKSSWSELKQQLTDEWKGSALFVSVLLCAGVSKSY